MSLSTITGSLVKTCKAKLLNVIEATCNDFIVTTTPAENALLIDAMAILQMINTIPNTFNHLANEILQQVIRLATFHKSSRVDFVSDRYPLISTKNAEREKRAQSGTQAFTIYSGTQNVPKQWKKFMSLGRNKEELINFLFMSWCECDPQILGNIILYITQKNLCYKIQSIDNHIIVTEVPELASDHEEADTRLVLHASHASLDYQNIVIRSPDTDVFVFALSTCLPSTAYFDTAVGNKRRIINIKKCESDLGNDLSIAMTGFHLFTGCDSTSAFYGKGKAIAFKVLRKKAKYLDAFKTLGDSVPPSDELVNILETYVCDLYGAEQEESVNSARYILFKSGKFSEEALPPNKDSLVQHIKRANYEAFIRKRSYIAVINPPSPFGNGWFNDQGSIAISWMEMPAAPDSLLDFVHCYCRDCSTKRCSCNKAGVVCTDLCKCNGCRNHGGDHQEADDDNQSDESYESESDND
ncbi:uncharacterized protein LOC136092782 [Hydra vulgaris]|uniref:uncharacterized protein LOC136092782 n=1 Tax=Hydra vulgaris TaxID=6087 RepID=UPI0032EA51C0